MSLLAKFTFGQIGDDGPWFGLSVLEIAAVTPNGGNATDVLFKSGQTVTLRVGTAEVVEMLKNAMQEAR